MSNLDPAELRTPEDLVAFWQEHVDYWTKAIKEDADELRRCKIRLARAKDILALDRKARLAGKRGRRA